MNFLLNVMNVFIDLIIRLKILLYVFSSNVFFSFWFNRIYKKVAKKLSQISVYIKFSSRLLLKSDILDSVSRCSYTDEECLSEELIIRMYNRVGFV